MTAAEARDVLKKSSGDAVISVLAPICALQFQQAPDATAKLTELKALSSYQQPKFVDEGGWAVMPGAEDPVDGVARSCAALLTTET